MIELWLCMSAITAYFVWTRMPPHKDWFELIMLVDISIMWPLLIVCAGLLIWEESE